MGDENKKSFWTSLPGILTGVAAVIVAVTGILAAYNHVAPPSSPPSHGAASGGSRTAASQEIAFDQGRGSVRLGEIRPEQRRSQPLPLARAYSHAGRKYFDESRPGRRGLPV